MKWFLFTYRAENYFYYFLDIHFKAISQFPICDLELISKNVYISVSWPICSQCTLSLHLENIKKPYGLPYEKGCIGSKWVDQWLKIQYNWYYSQFEYKYYEVFFYASIFCIFAFFFLFWEVSQGIKETDQGIILWWKWLAFILEMWNFISGWQIWFDSIAPMTRFFVEH